MLRERDAFDHGSRCWISFIHTSFVKDFNDVFLL